MAAKKKKKEEEGFLELRPIPGGKFDQFRKTKEIVRDKIPKNSNVFLYRMVDIHGSEDIVNMSEVGIGDYAYNKGINHAINMNVARNIPWIEDGLKSVERRVLYVMFMKGYYGKKSEKVASVVGDMISNVYPHGDQAPADTIYRLGRTRSMMIPYIRAIGNYGNMDEMKPAATRYAAASMSAYAYDCFFGDIGPQQPLYDERDNYKFNGKEPIYLISRYPNILMQWNLGIGKGAASWLGAFNSQDVFKAALVLMDDPNAKIDIYPDAPVPVEIVNRGKLRGCFDKKKFKVQMRAPYHIMTDQRKNGTKVEDKYTIVFTALPLGVTGRQVDTEIRELKLEDGKKGNKPKIPEVLNTEIIADDISPGGIQFIVEYERGYDPHILAEKLYKSTSLQKMIGVQYNLIFDNQPVLKTPREIMLIWINQRYDQKRRYYHQMVLKCARDRAMYEAIATVLATPDTIDKAVMIIRSAKDSTVAISGLSKEFGFTEFQSRMILQIRLQNLPKMSVQEMYEKRDKAIKDYKEYRRRLSSEEAIKESIREELEEGLKKYGKPRVSKLTNLKDTAALESGGNSKWILYNEDFYYAFDDPKALEEIGPNIDNKYRLVQVRNNDSVMVFDKNGNMKILNGYSFTTSNSGIAMASLGISNVAGIVSENSGSGYDSIVMVTEQGYGKMMDMPDCSKTGSRGNASIRKRRTINLNTDDKLIAVIPVKSEGHADSVVGMIQGDKMYYLHLSDFPLYKDSSAGNRMVKNVKNLALTNAIYFDATDSSDYMLIYGESGYIKLLDTAYLAFSKRGNNTVSLQGKNIVGATLLHGQEYDLTLYGGSVKGTREIRLQVGKVVKFTAVSTGEEQKFKMSTSIGNPVKVLKVTKNEWYALQ